MNQYFQLMERDGDAYLRIIPSLDGGEALGIKEVLAYLSDTGYQSYDLKELGDAVVQNAEEVQVFVGKWSGFHEQEKMKLTVSGDFMLVYARLYPPSDKGQLMDAAEIRRDLTSAGIQVGIQEEAIAKFIRNREYCKDLLFAKGIPPIQGKDAKISYLFNVNPNLKPKHNEDGTVNYHELNTINHVEKGQCLAKLEKEVEGKSGRNVYDEEIQARPVKTKNFSFSHNIKVSEDGTELYSQVTGHVSLVKGKVFVASVFEVPADVDTSTGNIDYSGNVLVKGNVKSGFRVIAKGDIIVEGVVEGADLKAGGQIIVKRGIHGMNKGRLEAGSNVIIKFIESATVISNGYIETESVLHSTVFAGTELKVGGKKGFINGGAVRAGNVISALNIGSEMGTGTKVEVGMDLETRERYYELQKQLADIKKEVDTIRITLKNHMEKAMKKGTTPQSNQQIQMMAKTLKERQHSMTARQEEYQKLHESLLLSNTARIKVHGTIYAGVWVGVAEVGINLKNKYSHSQLFKEKGEIVVRPL